MSWSISCGGAPAFVREQVEKQAASITYLVPAENALKDKVVALVRDAIEANAAAASVSVSAFGSQSSRSDANGNLIAVQSVNVSISASLP